MEDYSDKKIEDRMNIVVGLKDQIKANALYAETVRISLDSDLKNALYNVRNLAFKYKPTDELFDTTYDLVKRLVDTLGIKSNPI